MRRLLTLVFAGVLITACGHASKDTGPRTPLQGWSAASASAFRSVDQARTNLDTTLKQGHSDADTRAGCQQLAAAATAFHDRVQPSPDAKVGEEVGAAIESYADIGQRCADQGEASLNAARTSLAAADAGFRAAAGAAKITLSRSFPRG